MILASLGLAACGGAPAKVINVTLKTFSIGVSSSKAKAGDVTFHVQNDASDLTHELVIVRTDTPGHYVLICNLPEHYRAGMRTDLTVVP